MTVHENFERHHLVYQNNSLISVVQAPDNFVKVSFEQVGLVGANTVRGFLELEATVGKCTPTGKFNLPSNADPNSVPESLERAAFHKEAGHLMLMISQGIYRDLSQTLFDLNGKSPNRFRSFLLMIIPMSNPLDNDHHPLVGHRQP